VWKSLCVVLSFVLNIVNNFVPSSLNLVLALRLKHTCTTYLEKCFMASQVHIPLKNLTKFQKL